MIRVILAVLWGLQLYSSAADLAGLAPPAPSITNIQAAPDYLSLRFAPYPATETYIILSGSSSDTLVPDTNFYLAPYPVRTWATGINAGTNFGYEWRRVGTASRPSEFFRFAAIPVDSNRVVTTTALSRMAYGPSPDLLERLSVEGPEPWLAEQMAPWSIEETVSQTHTNVLSIENRFSPADEFVTATNASISDFRAWHILRAVGAKRQFLEVLLQFLENHFVTEFSKTRNFFAGYYDNSTLENRLATQAEYLENQKWRAALLKPDCTFHDLLRISAESPAMIVYLDTVTSRGDGTRIANENYARELLELFTFGVDNGYDQSDITSMSRAWTGWTLDKVDFAEYRNPFAFATTNIIPGSTNLSTTSKSNLFGVWAMNFRSNWHNASAKTIFSGKTVPERFGPPWEGRNYQLTLSNGSGTNGIRDGNQVLEHLANQPFTQEHISIKLCRLLVHEEFPSPSVDSAVAGYSFYDYQSGGLSPEANLVHDCMLAWENSNPKGQIWKVLEIIVRSDLFRSQRAAQQKVKTPLELAVSTVRALRSSTNNSGLAGSFTSFTDGYNLGGTSSSSSTPLTRMGEMLLFDREAPDGYPEAGGPWISAGTLAERIRFIQAFCLAPSQSGHGDAGNSQTACDPVGLLRSKLPPTSLRNAADVASFLVNAIYPGEGMANLQLYQEAAVSHLNTDDAGFASSFASLAVSSNANSAYDNRVRGVVAMLMTFHRFQEQ